MRERLVKVDKNNDGKISKTEFELFMSQLRPLNEQDREGLTVFVKFNEKKTLQGINEFIDMCE